MSTLSALLQSIRADTVAFDDIHDTRVVCRKKALYTITNASNVTVAIAKDALIKGLKLVNCRDICIKCERAPIRGVDMTNCVRVAATGEVGNYYFDLNQSAIIDIILYDTGTVDLYECRSIVLNEEELTDKYIDSTWIVI